LSTSSGELVNIQPNLGRLLGPGSTFALDGDAHRNRRMLLTPAFHGKRIKGYERIFEEETAAETSKWPQAKAFETLGSMQRITLNAILRAVFGADPARLDALRRVIPPWVALASLLVVVPDPPQLLRGLPPWRGLDARRAAYDRIVDELIDEASADRRLEDRDDILAILLRNSHDDRQGMTRRGIADELLTLLAAGHETTSATLAWTFERITRHPEVLAKLADEADGQENDYRQAVIQEVQRVRTVVWFTGRRVHSSNFELGQWVIPHGYSVMIPIELLHNRREEFPEPDRFDPQRFIGRRPNTFAWAPYGAGLRRCVGAAFATAEMDVVLRTVLRNFTVDETRNPAERTHSRGVLLAPADGGRITVHRRRGPALR
jgi:cytochrome P450